MTIIICSVVKLVKKNAAAAFSTIGTVNSSVSHLLLLLRTEHVCVRVLCMMFSVKEMYRKEIKRSEMKCEVMCCAVSRFALPFQTNVYFGHCAHIFIFFIVTTAARRQSVLTIVKWCYVFFMLYVFMFQIH